MLSNLVKKLALAAALTVGAALSPVADDFSALSAPEAFAQAAAAPAAGGAAAPKAPTVEEKSLWDELKQGGVVMIFLAIGSVFVVWFGIDGVIKTTRAKAIPPVQLAQFRELFKNGDYTGAFNYAKSSMSPLCDVVRAGITFLPDGKTMTEEAIFNEINRVNGNLMGRVSYLSVIGVCAPMVGLLGTVNGMRGAFASLGKSGAGDTAALSEHIGEVLIATATGLFVAIPAFILYYVMRNRISVTLHDLQESVASLFRKMPYEMFEGTQLGDDEIYANAPNWHGVGDTAGVPQQ